MRYAVDGLNVASLSTIVTATMLEVYYVAAM